MKTFFIGISPNPQSENDYGEGFIFSRY